MSSNIAPSTATVSVVHNAQFAAAYGGFPFFKPFEVAFQVCLAVIEKKMGQQLPIWWLLILYMYFLLP